MKTFGKKKVEEKKVEKKEVKKAVLSVKEVNGEVVISERDVVINGVTKKELTSKDGQTFIA